MVALLMTAATFSVLRLNVTINYFMTTKRSIPISADTNQKTCKYY
jgi:hypothetical protein